MRRYLDAVYAILTLETEDVPALDARLDEPLPNEISDREARQLELRRNSRQNREALTMLGGLSLGKG